MYLVSTCVTSLAYWEMSSGRNWADDKEYKPGESSLLGNELWPELNVVDLVRRVKV